MTQPATYALRLPRSLKAAVAEVVKRDGTSINNFITLAIAEKLSAMETVRFLRNVEIAPMWILSTAFLTGMEEKHRVLVTS